jgi:hypothetical protein
MTIEDAKQIAHGLMQGYVGSGSPSHGYAEFLRRARASATSRPSARLERSRRGGAPYYALEERSLRRALFCYLQNAITEEKQSLSSTPIIACKEAIAMTEWNEDFSVDAFRKLDETKPLDPGLSGRVTLSYTQLSLIIDRMGWEQNDAKAFWKLAKQAGAVTDELE